MKLNDNDVVCFGFGMSASLQGAAVYCWVCFHLVLALDRAQAQVVVSSRCFGMGFGLELTPAQ